MSANEDSPPVDDTPDLMQDGGSNDDDDGDLFGEDDEADQRISAQERFLDDPELDSGDDIGRDDRVANTVEDGAGEDEDDSGREQRLLDCEIPRTNFPMGDEFYLLNMPPFLGVKQQAFDMATFEADKLPHDGDPDRQTSAYSTAMSSMFWRRDPSDSSRIQSTARFIRWSDGSLTLQLATKPQEQYRVTSTAMRQNFNRSKTAQQPYDPTKDSLTFLAAPHTTDAIDLQLIHALDASMKIVPSSADTNESEARLRLTLLKAKEEHDPLARMKDVKEDPELARKAAEQFEKERLRAQKRRENAEDRQTVKRNTVLGRAGLGPRSGGLSIAGLEDDVGMPISRGKRAQKRRTNHRGEIYSDDEDETLPRGRTREDEYDREDGFVADSDEEPEQYGDDDDLLDDEEDDPDKDDLEIEGRQTVVKDRAPRRREDEPKRSRMDEIDDDDDAEGEPDDELLAQAQVRKKRRVIDDEDEEE